MCHAFIFILIYTFPEIKNPIGFLFLRKHWDCLVDMWLGNKRIVGFFHLLQQNFLFIPQAEPFIYYLKALSSYQKNVCGALMKFGPQILQSM